MFFSFRYSFLMMISAVVFYLVAFFKIIQEPASTNPNHPPAEVPVTGASPTHLYPSIQDDVSENGPLLQSTAGE